MCCAVQLVAKLDYSKALLQRLQAKHQFKVDNDLCDELRQLGDAEAIKGGSYGSVFALRDTVRALQLALELALYGHRPGSIRRATGTPHTCKPQGCASPGFPLPSCKLAQLFPSPSSLTALTVVSLMHD
jgi:hypothetical protein